MASSSVESGVGSALKMTIFGTLEADKSHRKDFCLVRVVSVDAVIICCCFVSHALIIVGGGGRGVILVCRHSRPCHGCGGSVRSCLTISLSPS